MTEALFIQGRYTKKIIIPSKIIDELPDKLIIFSSVQFAHELNNIKAQLKKRGKKVISYRSKNFLYEGMESDEGVLLGCNLEMYDTQENPLNNKQPNENIVRSSQGFDAFFYIGDGLFHPKALLLNNRKDIYCYDPKSSTMRLIEKEQQDIIIKKRIGGMASFLSSKKVGILISKKPGQDQTDIARSLGRKIIKRWPEKKVFLFIADSIDFSELENFNFIDIYINTACPRIGYDDTVRSPKPIINISDIKEIINKANNY